MGERGKIIKLIGEAGLNLAASGQVSNIEIHADKHDIHGYYTLAQRQETIIHVQGYPGLSTQETARVWSRAMDAREIQRLREVGNLIGNEHSAQIKDFPNFGIGVDIPYNPHLLGDMIKSNIEGLFSGSPERR
jgi:hypothetical protein